MTGMRVVLISSDAGEILYENHNATVVTTSDNFVHVDTDTIDRPRGAILTVLRY